MEYKFKSRKLSASFKEPLNEKEVNYSEAYFYSFYKPLYISEHLTTQKVVIDVYQEIVNELNKIQGLNEIVDVWFKVSKLISKIFPPEQLSKIDEKEASMLFQRQMGIKMSINSNEGEVDSTYFASDTGEKFERDYVELATKRMEIKIIIDLVKNYFSDLFVQHQSPAELDSMPYLKLFRSNVFLEQIFMEQRSKEEIESIDYDDDTVIITSNPIKMGGRNTVSAMACSEIQQDFCHVKCIRDDINQLCKIIGNLKLDYEIKLLAKYIVMEAFEFEKYSKKLINKINHDKKNWKPVKVEISKNLINFFDNSQNPFWRKIRDKIAAHRDKNWEMTELHDCWDYLTVNSINELINIVEHTFAGILVSNHFLFSPFTTEGIALKGVLGVEGPFKRKRFFDDGDK